MPSRIPNYAVHDKEGIFDHLDVCAPLIKEHGFFGNFDSDHILIVDVFLAHTRYYCLAKLDSLSQKKARKIHDKIVKYLKDNKYKKIFVHTSFTKSTEDNSKCEIILVRRSTRAHRHKFQVFYEL